MEPKSLAWDATVQHLVPDADGLLRLPERPGLGVDPDLAALRPYLLDVEIRVGGRTLYETPRLA